MITRLLAITSLALAVAITPALAAKPGKGQKGAQPGRLLARFDRDHNGTIDGQEATRAQAVYGALAALDTDKNGQLSEAELAAAKIPEGKKGAGKAGKGGKKAAATTPTTLAPSTSSSTTTPAKP